MAATPSLPEAFLDRVLGFDTFDVRIRWYSCVIVTLSSLNYPDVIPQVYRHLKVAILDTLGDDESKRKALNRIREGLIKSTGIVGAGRTGNAMRALSDCIPETLRELQSPRSQEPEQQARARGKEFWTNIYARNPAFDPEASVRASPDYAFVVRGRLLFLSLCSFWRPF